MKSDKRSVPSKADKIRAFDPNGIGRPGTMFGLPFTPAESEVVIIPAPWDATASFGAGTAHAPAAILAASPQIDLFDADVRDAWRRGIAMLPIPQKWQRRNAMLRLKAKRVIDHLERGGSIHDAAVHVPLKHVRLGCRQLASWVKREAHVLLARQKLVGVLGGDHSVALGLMEALGDRYRRYGVLHVDAHFDLREAYEGFEYSHASIMRNASKLAAIRRFVHVGIRDYCEEEYKFVASSGGRHLAFMDRDIQRRLFEGTSWRTICGEIIRPLPSHVYVSFDIDGLDPSLCRHTGTPVPGGLGFEQVFYLVRKIAESGRTLIGFDLCEVAPASSKPSAWEKDQDAAVGMRALYRLAVLSMKSRGGA